jgi:hypothetical protein
VPIRLQRLKEDEVRQFFASRRESPLAGRELEERVALAGGSIGAALDEAGDSGKAYRAAGELIEAVLSGRGPVLERALKQAPYAARGEFTAMLDALAETLGEAARSTLGHPARRPVPEALRSRNPGRLLKAMEHVAEAREAAWGNVNPQILLAVLGEELTAAL